MLLRASGKVPISTWAGLLIAFFGLLIARGAVGVFFPSLSATMALGPEPLLWRFILGESLIWLCVAALLIVIWRGEKLILRSINLGTSPITNSIIWGVVLAVLCGVVGAVVATLTHFKGGNWVRPSQICGSGW